MNQQPQLSNRIHSGQTILADDGLTIETADLYLAAFLMSRGCTLFGSTRRERRIYFGLQPVEGAEHPVNIHTEWMAWVAGQAMVNATAFTNHIKSLKSLVHSV